MVTKASEVLNAVGVIAQDEENVRWPLAELRVWLNEAQNIVVMHKPNATARSVVIELAEGTLQTLDAAYLSLIAVPRNLKSAQDSPRLGARAITPSDRATLDGIDPDWHDTDRCPATKLVRHVIADPAVPREFYVYPGNDGTGIIEASVSVVPTPVPVPVGDPEDIASYEIDLDIEDIYASALVDYTLYRAYSKDAAIPALAARAQAHYGQFASALGIKLTGEQRYNANRRFTEGQQTA